MQKPIYTDDPKKGKVFVGVFDIETNTLMKTVGMRHFFRNLRGYALQKSVYEKIVEKNANVHIKTSTGCIYTSTACDWVEHGVDIQYEHGVQRLLPVSFMKEL